MSDESSPERVMGRIGQKILMKFSESWQSAECVADGRGVVTWETADGKSGFMTARLWDLNRERQRIEGESEGSR